MTATTAPRTWEELGQLCGGVARERFSRWRRKYRDTTTPCPESKDLAEWRQWFRATGRTDLAALLAEVTGTNPAAEHAYDAEPAAAADRQQSFAAGDNVEPRTKADWDAVAAKEKALRAQRERELLERDVVHADDLVAFATAVGQVTLDELAQLPVLIRPALDGLNQHHRRAVEQQLQQAVTTIRRNLSRRGAEALRAQLEPQAR